MLRPRACAPLLLLATACRIPVPYADPWFFETKRDQLPRAEDCRRCHGAIWEEWSRSRHAGAWTAETFVNTTADYAADECLACHAPGPLGSAGEVELRADHRSEGVTCITCHLSPDPGHPRLTMRGPFDRTTPIDVHPVIADPLYRRPDLCGGCHTDVLGQWRSSAEPADGRPRAVCQDCHMPAVHRRIETYDPAHRYSAVVVALADPIDGRRHTFSLPSEPWSDIALTVSAGLNGGLLVTVDNRIPHAIPTGAYGRRESRLRVIGIHNQTVRLLRADLDETIPAASTRTFEFPETPPEPGLQVVLERRDPRTGAWRRLAPAPPALSGAEETQ